MNSDIISEKHWSTTEPCIQFVRKQKVMVLKLQTYQATKMNAGSLHLIPVQTSHTQPITIYIVKATFPSGEKTQNKQNPTSLHNNTEIQGRVFRSNK